MYVGGGLLQGGGRHIDTGKDLDVRGSDQRSEVEFGMEADWVAVESLDLRDAHNRLAGLHTC